jgi:hypothetical protein
MTSVQLRPFLLLTTCNSDKLMHPPTYVYTHISVYNTIIEDNKLVCNQSTKYLTIAMNNHYSNLDIDTIDHGKINRLYHTLCLPSDYSRYDGKVL